MNNKQIEYQETNEQSYLLLCPCGFSMNNNDKKHDKRCNCSFACNCTKKIGTRVSHPSAYVTHALTRQSAFTYGVWKMWSMENKEYGKCGVWKMWSMENASFVSQHHREFRLLIVAVLALDQHKGYKELPLTDTIRLF